MKTTLSFLLLCISAFAFLCGCGTSSPTIDQNYVKSSTELSQKVDAMFKRTGGDYEQLTPEERKTYLDSFSGNEPAAKAYWEKMKTGNIRGNVPVGAPVGN